MIDDVMIDKVTKLVDGRIRREVEAGRRKGIVARIAGVSVNGAARTRSDPDRSLRSAPVFDLMAYVVSRRVRGP
jgi:hypothetical protein